MIVTLSSFSVCEAGIEPKSVTPRDKLFSYMFSANTLELRAYDPKRIVPVIFDVFMILFIKLVKGI